MEERNYCVYKHTSPSGKVYIGITKQTANCRWKNGNGYKSSPHFWNAIQKYGWENFSHEILFEGLSVENACAEEQRLIRRYKSMDSRYGYNDRAGGQIGSHISDEVRKRMSDIRKQFFLEHPEERKALSDKIRGFHHTDESKKKMSDAAQKRHYVLSEEWKRNIGNANKKRLEKDFALYEETCLRCRANGKKVSNPIIQLTKDGEFVAEYKSAHEAERVTGIPNGNIGRCCKGISNTAGGYKWQYASLYNGSRETA